MTHYRLTLTQGRAPAIAMLAEAHKDLPTLPRGWARRIRANASVSAHLRRCYVGDEECAAFTRGGMGHRGMGGETADESPSNVHRPEHAPGECAACDGPGGLTEAGGTP